MLEQKSEKWIALSVIFGALVMVTALALSLGKIPLGGGKRILRVQFESVGGISKNTLVKYAGAPVGRVEDIRVLKLKEQTRGEKGALCVELSLSVPGDLELGSDLLVAVKQEGLLGSKYVALVPGAVDAAPLDDKQILVGESSIELGDLAGPGKAMMAELTPTAKNLKEITAKLNDRLPTILENVDGVLKGGNNLLAAAKTPEGKEQIRKLLSNLRVISDNLKVVSTQAKGMTSTLGERPWSLLWGGEPNQLPTEEEILASEKVIPLKKATQKTPAKK
jgi:ABC-type transporter Mla subunit MlaD